MKPKSVADGSTGFFKTESVENESAEILGTGIRTERISEQQQSARDLEIRICAFPLYFFKWQNYSLLSRCLQWQMTPCSG